jgi:pyruvate dehydrogenase E2 component (dihydrolipoamide acetyltransferase)
MSYEFRLPDIGEGVAEGEVVRWFVKAGDAVKEDDPLVSVLTDKANVEIPSPKSGKVLTLHAQVGEKVKVGGLLVTIETGSTDEPKVRSEPPHSTGEPTTATRAGDKPSPPDASAGGSARILASPFLRRRATELGVDLSRVQGTGPGGRITEADVESAKSGGPLPSPAKPRSGEPALPSPPSSTRTAGGGEILERVPIRGIRRVIAEHMADSVHRAAHFTYVEEVDVSELIILRDRMAKHVEKQGVRLSFLPFIVKAVVSALKAHPRINATMDDAHEELLVRSSYHIGIATASADGLIVPVVHNADRKSVVALAREIQDLAERGRAGKLSREELTGSSFTITSLGALGGVLATPILNYPEVAILGVHKIRRRPVYRADGSLGPADLMNLSISLDHRVLDGIEGAQFLATVKGYLEDPHQLFAELA